MNRTAMTQLSLNLTYLMFRFCSANVMFVQQFFGTCLVLIGKGTGYSVTLSRYFPAWTLMHKHAVIIVLILIRAAGLLFAACDVLLSLRTSK